MFKNILLPIDLNDENSWQSALPKAIDLCRQHGAKLHVMTVVPDIFQGHVAQYFPEGYEDELIDRTDEELRKLIRQQVPDDIEAKDTVAYGSIYHEILATAEKVGADLIVMTSHRPELKDYLIGPNATKVVRHAKCSVMVVRS